MKTWQSYRRPRLESCGICTTYLSPMVVFISTGTVIMQPGLSAQQRPQIYRRNIFCHHT